LSTKLIKKAEGKPKILIYCGANLPEGILQQYAIFKNGLPKILIEHIQRCPAIGELMVTPDQLTKVRANIAIKGTRENLLYQQTLEYGRRKNE
jgi:hypothetical protein